ncbi:MAG: PilZ domain-containing protein [Spirochaetota bacterium]
MEKRKTSRVEFDIRASIHYNGNSSEGDVRDLSLQGLFLETEQDVPAGTRLTVDISLQGSTSDLVLKVMGTVVRHENGGIAIHFDEMDLDSFIHIRNIVSYNEGDGDKVREEFASMVKEHAKQEKE